MDNGNIFDFIAHNGDIVIPLAGMGLALAIVAISIVFGTMKSMARSKQVEQSRREIAAYVAEGSISPDDAEKLLEAKIKPNEC
jgi:hypothetical protein